MANAVMNAIQKRPALVIGGGVGLVILLALMRGGSGGGDTLGAALQSQRIASDTNVALAGIQADVQKAQSAATIARNNAAKDIIIASENFAQETARANIGAGIALFSRAQDSADVRAQLRTQETLVTREIDASTAVAFGDQNLQYRMLDRKLSHEADLSKELMDRYDRNLPSMMEQEARLLNLSYVGQAHLINTDYSGAINLARTTGEPARIAAETARNQQRWGVAQDIAKGLAKLFGG